MSASPPKQYWNSSEPPHPGYNQPAKTRRKAMTRGEGGAKVGMGCEVAAETANGGGSLAPPPWPGSLAAAHTGAAKRIRCSDGCLNRLIGLAAREIATDGWKERGEKHGGRKM